MARPAHEDFGRVFQRVYKEAGLTQEDLAEYLRRAGWVKVDQPLVSRWSRGLIKIPPEILPDVDAACGMPKGYVLEKWGLVDAQALVDQRRRAETPVTNRRRPRRPATAARREPRAG